MFMENKTIYDFPNLLATNPKKEIDKAISIYEMAKSFIDSYRESVGQNTTNTTVVNKSTTCDINLSYYDRATAY